MSCAYCVCIMSFSVLALHGICSFLYICSFLFTVRKLSSQVLQLSQHGAPALSGQGLLQMWSLTGVQTDIAEGVRLVMCVCVWEFVCVIVCVCV